MSHITNDTVSIATGDVEIGAVELKNATDDTRAKIGAASGLAESDNALAVQAPVLGATTGAAVVTDANGTLQQYLRGLVKLFIAEDFATQATLATISGNITACNTGAIAGSVTANAGTNLNTSALALESGGNLATVAGDTTSLDAKVPSIGPQAAASSISVAPTTVNRSAALEDSGATSGTSTETGQMAVGWYELTVKVDTHYRQGATGGTAVTTDPIVKAGERLLFYVSDTTNYGYLQLITDGATGYYWLADA